MRSYRFVVEVTFKYVVNYGMTPFFAERLKKQVGESEWLVVCYGESLKNIIQKSEMDLVFKFCDTYKNKVQVRYWDSMFLGHETTADLLKKINDRLSGLDLSKKKSSCVCGGAQRELVSSLRYEKRKRGSWIE